MNITTDKQKIDLENNMDIIDVINNIYNDIKYNGMAYNHTIKAFCYLEYYNDDIFIIVNNTLSCVDMDEIKLKLIISNKKKCSILNMLTNTHTIITEQTF
jgi:hypothetical protein